MEPARTGKDEQYEQAGIAILISNKIDFQPKFIKKNEKGHLIYQRKNPPNESLNSKYLCPKCKSTYIHKRSFTKSQDTH
jgi:predicted SprT family Zn-dependent metalloprotease